MRSNELHCVQPSVIDAGRSHASGPGLESAQQYEEAPFVVHTCDVRGNPRRGLKGESVRAILVRNPQAVPHSVSAVPDGLEIGLEEQPEEGILLGRYIPCVAGAHEVHILSGTGEQQAHIHGSPFPVVIEEGAIAARCIASGEGVRSAVAGARAPFSILAMNSSGRVVPFGPMAPVAISFDPDGAAGDVVVAKQGKSCECSYVAGGLSHIQVHVNVRSEPIPGSPFQVAIAPGAADARFSRVAGPGLASAFALYPAMVTIEAHDAFGTALRTGGTHFAVSIRDEAGRSVHAIVDDLDNGKHEVSFVLPSSGDYELDVTHGGLSVPPTPTRLFATPAADAGKSDASGPGLETPVVDESTWFKIVTRSAEGALVNWPLDGPDGVVVRICDAQSMPVEYISLHLLLATPFGPS